MTDQSHLFHDPVHDCTGGQTGIGHKEAEDLSLTMPSSSLPVDI